MRSVPPCQRGSGLNTNSRYAAMVSHAIKILMPYSPTQGNLLVRGAAMRSQGRGSGSQFGVALLARRFRLCAMQGRSIEGIARYYQAKRKRRYGVGPVHLPPMSATRMRLSKESKTSLATRAKHTEAAIWRRCLRLEESSRHAGEPACASTGRNKACQVWLPDEADDASPISDEEEADEVEKSDASLFSAPSAPPLADRQGFMIASTMCMLATSYA